MAQRMFVRKRAHMFMRKYKRVFVHASMHTHVRKCMWAGIGNLPLLHWKITIIALENYHYCIGKLPLLLLRGIGKLPGQDGR